MRHDDTSHTAYAVLGAHQRPPNTYPITPPTARTRSAPLRARSAPCARLTPARPHAGACAHRRYGSLRRLDDGGAGVDGTDWAWAVRPGLRTGGLGVVPGLDEGCAGFNDRQGGRWDRAAAAGQSQAAPGETGRDRDAVTLGPHGPTRRPQPAQGQRPGPRGGAGPESTVLGRSPAQGPTALTGVGRQEPRTVWWLRGSAGSRSEVPGAAAARSRTDALGSLTTVGGEGEGARPPPPSPLASRPPPCALC